MTTASGSNALLEADPPRARSLAVKVPEITVYFWIIKVLSTAMGEALSDFLDGGSGLFRSSACWWRWSSSWWRCGCSSSPRAT